MNDENDNTLKDNQVITTDKPQSKTKTKVALYGGSFDPPTIAHMQIACELYNTFDDIDEVWLSPCASNRSDKNIGTPANHRLNMLNLIKDDMIPSSFPLIIDKTEAEKGDFIPTYHRLKELTATYPDKEFICCVGTDILPNLKSWIEGEKLINEFEFILILRENYLIKDLPNITYPKTYRVLETIISGSSTDVRNRIKTRNKDKMNLAINGLTTQRVIKYIESNSLYQINNN